MSDDAAPCSECGSTEIVWEEPRRELVCQACGLVIDTEGQELEPEGPAPAGEPGAGGSSGSELSGALWRAQAKADEKPSSERRMILVRQEARRVADALDCPADIGEQAGDLVERAREEGITQGRPLEALAAASLMAACRMLHLVRTEERIEEAAKADWSEIKAAYKALVRGLDLPIPPMTAHEYMGQLASELGVPGPREAQARDILQEICGTEEAAGKDPLGWAAASLVHVCQEEGEALSMNAAAEAAGVSPSTVKARLEDLRATESS